MPLLPRGHRPLRVLHLSDVHMTPGQRRKQEWLAGLASLRPDLVVNTGDNLAHRDSVPVVRDSLGDAARRARRVRVRLERLLLADPAQPGALPAARRRQAQHAHAAPAVARARRRRSARRAGWTSPTARDALTVGDTTFAFAGVDDPHLELDRLDAVAGPADPDADVRLAVAHAPYLRVLDQFAGDGYDAIVAGHTHGGQVCVPVRRRADDQLRPRAGAGQGPAPASRGLPRRRSRARPGCTSRPALGTSPYARIRVACRPEATLMTLVPRA